MAELIMGKKKFRRSTSGKLAKVVSGFLAAGVATWAIYSTGFERGLDNGTPDKIRITSDSTATAYDRQGDLYSFLCMERDPLGNCIFYQQGAISR